MIKIENRVIPSPEQWEAVIMGCRNPFNSHDKSDSEWNVEHPDIFYVGKKDLTLMNRLANAGDDHGKFMRMLPVIVDITAPHYWWPEMDQYKVGTVTDSCSKMHTLLQKEFTLDDFSYSDLTKMATEQTITRLNFLRDKYLKEDDERVKKVIWRGVLEMLPLSYNQKRTWSGNYQVLKRIYWARRGHKLVEWKSFLDFIETLPYAKELIIGEVE